MHIYSGLFIDGHWVNSTSRDSIEVISPHSETALGRAPAASKQDVDLAVAVGVVAATAPWNMPRLSALTKLVPALLAGCTVVLKPGVETPIDALRLAELIESIGLPRGVVNGVTGDGTVGVLAESLGVDDPLDERTEVGPVVTRRQQQRVDDYIAIGQDEGARVVAGGTGMPAGLDNGWYVRPTVFADVDSKMRIAKEEIFGPVLSVIPYEDVNDAVRVANEWRYGLAGTVWTSDVERGMAIARRIRTGSVGINQYMPDLAAPLGGFKDSGFGRECVAEGIDQYVEVQSLLPGVRV